MSSDADFSVASVLRPFDGFEAVYQGKPGNTPIAIPGNLAPQALAGVAGYDPNLIAGVSVPFGSKIVLWLPAVAWGSPGQSNKYQYSVVFRLRNIRDFNGSRTAYHFPRESLGENAQQVIPAANRVILFEGGRVPTEAEASVTQSHTKTRTSLESFTVSGSQAVAPLTPSGTPAALQQGIGPLGSLQGNQGVTYNAVQLDCEGDEMIILVSKDSAAPWNFNDLNHDQAFGNFFGKTAGKAFSALGIYVFTGSNP